MELYDLVCSRCGFTPALGLSHIYALDEFRAKIRCSIVDRVATDQIPGITGMSLEAALEAGRIVGIEYCFCRDCLHEFGLDCARNPVVCEKCDGVRIAHETELLDAPCPKCNQETMTKRHIGWVC